MRGATERELRVDVHESRDVDDGEEQVTELVLDAEVGLGLGGGPTGTLDLDEQLVELLPQLREWTVEVETVKDNG